MNQYNYVCNCFVSMNGSLLVVYYVYYTSEQTQVERGSLTQRPQGKPSVNYCDCLPPWRALHVAASLSLSYIQVEELV
jgi:hypothetical protein